MSKKKYSFDVKKLEDYLSRLYGSEIDLISIIEIGKQNEVDQKKTKEFGYGIPYQIEFFTNGKRKSLILETMRSNIFGHEYSYDRAQSLLMAHLLYNKLSRHVKSIDVGAFMKDGNLKSLSDYDEFFILMDKAKGKEYFRDLERIRNEKKLTDLDKERCRQLSDYLTEIHCVKKNSPQLYKRRVRELIGHGECIMGLIDSYPSKLDFTSDEELESIEKKCVSWRWKLKKKTNRLCQVHGDFHPWNLLFESGTNFSVLDRSRGEWGEPADDVAAMTINYLFFSLLTYGHLKGPFKVLFNQFFNNYLEKMGDKEILNVIQPYYSWRALVLASPIWYPNLKYDIRRKLFNFIHNILESDWIELEKINIYFEKNIQS